MDSLPPEPPAVHHAAPADLWPFPDCFPDEAPALPASAYFDPSDPLDLDDAVFDVLAGESGWYDLAHNRFLP